MGNDIGFPEPDVEIYAMSSLDAGQVSLGPARASIVGLLQAYLSASELPTAAQALLDRVSTDCLLEKYYSVHDKLEVSVSCRRWTRATRRITSRTWYTELDAECDKQSKIVGRLLTTFGDGVRAVAKFFSPKFGTNFPHREVPLFLKIF